MYFFRMKERKKKELSWLNIHLMIIFMYTQYLLTCFL